MSYKEAGRELGLNNSSLGYILTSNKVDDVYNAIHRKYQEYTGKI